MADGAQQLRPPRALPIDRDRLLQGEARLPELPAVGGFSENWVYWSEEYENGEALLFAGASAIQYSGTMTVTYEYSPTEE